MRSCFIVLFVVLPAVVMPQPAETEVRWGALKTLEGRWEGAIDGRLGTGNAVRVYEFVLDGKYLMMRHASVRPVQEKSPDGDHHREIAIFSFDSTRKKIVLREFMIEDVVPTSVCEPSGSRIVCVTESVEGGPGIRARLTLDIDKHSFVETYELAFPGDDELQHYFTNRWSRLPVLP